MRLSDIMSRLDLTLYPQIALVLFLIIFVGAMKRVFARARTEEFKFGASLPLESDDSTSANSHDSGSNR